jgi:hypothetical protein
MNDQVRQKLCEIIAEYGESLCDAPKRCEALLRDVCGEHKPEIHALVAVLKKGGVAQLLSSRGDMASPILLAHVTRSLWDELALSEEATGWAVESWALALGIIPRATCIAGKAESLVPLDEAMRPRRGQRSGTGGPAGNGLCIEPGMGRIKPASREAEERSGLSVSLAERQEIYKQLSRWARIAIVATIAITVFLIVGLRIGRRIYSYFQSGRGSFVAEKDPPRVADLPWWPNLPQKFHPRGIWRSKGSGDRQFRSVEGIAVDSCGDIFVSDSANQTIQKLDSSGRFLLKWGSRGYGDGQFRSPMGIAVDSSGNVYVADRDNSRIQKFDSRGNFLTKWGSVGTGDGEFWAPCAIAVDPWGYVFVLDGRMARVQKFDSSGRFLTKWGRRREVGGEFDTPCGIFVDSSGNVYVMDGARVQKFDSSGNFLNKWTIPAPGRSYYNQYAYRCAAADSSGNLYYSGDDCVLVIKPVMD